MSNTDKGPCPPTADLVAKETGNKEASKQSILHILWWPGGRGRQAWGVPGLTGPPGCFSGSLCPLGPSGTAVPAWGPGDVYR